MNTISRTGSVLVFTLIVIGLLVVAGGAGFFWLRQSKLPDQNQPAPQTTSEADASYAWVEVINSGVFRVSSSSASSSAASTTELSSGDILLSGDTISTDTHGVAVVHFPDTSIVRVDTDTKFSIQNFSYNPENHSIILELFVDVGRVWSKIFELATPESLWQVKTSNAVATVRGTSFGVEYQKGKSRIIGSEHTVHVVPVLSDKKKTLDAAGADVSEDKVVVVEDQAVLQMEKQMSSGRAVGAMAVRDATVQVKSEGWVVSARKLESNFDTTRHDTEGQLKTETKKQEVDRAQLRDRMRDSFEKPYKTEIEKRVRLYREQRLKNQQQTDQRPVAPTPGTLPGEPIIKPSGTTASTSASTTPPVVIPGIKLPISDSTGLATGAKITISTKADISKIADGASVSFFATFTDLSGKNIDITRQAKWIVVGDIGSFSSPGVFAAHLTGNNTELEKAPGAILISWVNPVTQKEISAKTDIFYVNNAAINTGLPADG